MGWLWLTLTFTGAVLAAWALLSLPLGTSMVPRPPKVRVGWGPYRFMKHPMYWGNTLFISGLGGLAAGWINALALGLLAHLVAQDWAAREH